MSSIFGHGVASGDPTTAAVVIWTHLDTDAESAPLSWKLARDPELSDVVASGELVAEAEHDHCVSTDVDGLEPGTVYHYGFEADGDSSPVGRTKTLPPDGVERVRFAYCSCARFNAGFFNGYARIAERADELDFLLHLGDYIYETGEKPAPGQTPGADVGRPFEPLNECKTLDDYRTRYDQYHRDPDVQAMHRSIPIIPTVDDHEFADGAWGGGSDAHDPERDGPWADRKAAALRARGEWLPIRPPDPADLTRAFREINFGGLADAFLLDIRSRRDKPALEPEMSEPTRSMMGAEQKQWLFAALPESKAPWRLLCSPSILNRTFCEEPSPLLQETLLKLKLIDEDGEGPDEDQWDGYPAEREALLGLLSTLDDVVVLSGDIHVSAVGQVHGASGNVVPEMTTPSLTSQNLDEKLGVPQRGERVVEGEKAMLERLDWFQWCELSSHGYVVVDVDAERVRAEWNHVDKVTERTPNERVAATFEVRRGTKKAEQVA